MSKFVQVGMSAMRDPATGQMLESVPLYVECKHVDQVPLIDVKQMTWDLLKYMQSREAEVKGNDAVSDV